MSKHTETAPGGDGEALLRAWGVAADDVDGLRAAFGRDPAADIAIVERLVQVASAAAATALADLEASAGDKAVRKEIRRGLFRLERRGVERPKKAAAAAVVAPLGGPEIEGYMSASDGNGDQLLWLVKARRGELSHLFAVVNDPAGMREAELHPVTRKLLRAAREDLLRKHDIRIVAVDWRFCDQRMSQAYRWAIEAGVAVEGDYLGMRNQILGGPPVEVPHPIFSVFDAAAMRADPGLAAVDSDALLQENELRTWLPSAAVLQPYLEEIDKAQNSPVLLNQAQQTERLGQIVAGAVEELFAGAAGESYRRRLLDLAWVLHASGRDEMARRALAAAVALESSPRGGTGIPFCEGLVRLGFSLQMRAAAEAAQERQRESLILTPQEAARDAAKRRGR